MGKTSEATRRSSPRQVKKQSTKSRGGEPSSESTTCSAKYDPYIDGKGPPLQDDKWYEQITKLEPKPGTKCLTLASWNINGINACTKSSVLGDHPKGALGRYIDAERPDILCLNETKLSQKTVTAYTGNQIDAKYTAYHALCQTKNGYSGVCLLIRNTLLPRLQRCLPDNEIPELKPYNDEGRVIVAWFDTFVIVGCYVMNAGQQLKRLTERVTGFDKTFQKYLRKLLAESKRPVICCGDINCAKDEIDIWNSKANQKSSGHTKEERESLSKFFDTSEYTDIWRATYPTTRRYTYWPQRMPQQRLKNLGWRIDAFVAPKSLLPVPFITMRDYVKASDHCPIVMAFGDVA